MTLVRAMQELRGVLDRNTPTSAPTDLLAEALTRLDDRVNAAARVVYKARVYLLDAKNEGDMDTEEDTREENLDELGREVAAFDRLCKS